MKTYLSVWFNSEGARPTEVTKELEELGFEVTQGPHDFTYEWSKGVSTAEILGIGDRIQEALKGFEVVFSLETI